MSPDWVDLAQFAIDDGLLVRVEQHPTGMTSIERMELLNRARAAVAMALTCRYKPRETRCTRPAREGQMTVQCGEQFAVVSAWGRVLVCLNRWQLHGICHPDAN